MASFSRLLLCCGLVNEAYSAAKMATRTQQQIDLMAADSEQGQSSQKELAAQLAANRERQHHLRFWLLFGLYSYAEPLVDASVGKVVPLYGLIKFVLTGALVAPNSTVRTFLYSYLQAHLLRADTLVQRHSSALLRSVSYTSQRVLLTALGWIMQQSVAHLSDDQLDDVQQRAAVLTREAKREKIQRLHESVQLLAMPDADEMGAAGAEIESTAGRTIHSRDWTAAEVLALQSTEVGSSRRSSPRHSPSADDQENIDPSGGPTDLACSGTPASAAAAVAATPTRPFELSSPTRQAVGLTSPMRVGSHQRTASRNAATLLTTPSKAAGGSILSHRLGALEEHGNSISALRERTHTPQKVVHFEAAATPGSAEPQMSMKKKRQTMGL